MTILIGQETLSLKIAHSFFLVTDRGGTVRAVTHYQTV